MIIFQLLCSKLSYPTTSTLRHHGAKAPPSKSPGTNNRHRRAARAWFGCENTRPLTKAKSPWVKARGNKRRG
jgi:hypothetical protein